MHELGSRSISILTRRRSLVLLLAVSFCLGAAYAFTMFPLPVVAGTGPFWDFPRGVISGSGSGSANDLAGSLVGYLYLMRAPWTLPILYAPNLGAPAGTNIFWLDAIPIVSLMGRAVFATTGCALNLLGLFVFGCYALPGVAMTILLAAAGQRTLLAAVAGTALAETTPYLLFGWGRALNAQFLIILALALYVAGSRYPRDWRVTAGWVALLAVTFLTNMYLFVMVGGCWTAGLVQKLLNRQPSASRVTMEAVCAITPVIFLAAITGILSPDLASASAAGFGELSMNLASPFVPQMSGLIPGLSSYRVGMGMQHEGFAYLGLGVLLLLLLTVRANFRWLRKSGPHHAALIVVLVGYVLFALSNAVYFGSHLLFALPLPGPVTHALGTFRSSGRFFWPVGYAIVALVVLQVMRNFPQPVSVALILAASLLRLAEVEPLRRAVAASTAYPRAAALSRQLASRTVAHADGVLVFPTYGCVLEQFESGGLIPPKERGWLGFANIDPFGAAEVSSAWPQSVREAVAWRELLLQANMEIQLIAARVNVPINSVRNARIRPDCAKEDALMHAPLDDGKAYFYFGAFRPSFAQLRSHAYENVCFDMDWLHYCLLPARNSEARGRAPPRVAGGVGGEQR